MLPFKLVYLIKFFKNGKNSNWRMVSWEFRAVGRSENPWVPVLFGGHNLPPLVEIGLTDLPKSGGATPRDDRPGIHTQN